MIALTKRTALSTPPVNKGFAQYDGNRGAWVWVDEAATPWYFGEQRVKLDADLTGITTTTLVDVTGLALQVKAGQRCDFEFELVFQVAGTSGIKVGLTIPAASTIFNALVKIAALKTSPAVDITHGIINSSGGAIVSAGSLDTVVNARARVRGTLVNGVNAGTIQLQWAAATAASGAVTPKQGSTGRLWTQ